MENKRLFDISDEDAIECAKIALIKPDYSVERFSNPDDGCIVITGKSGRAVRSLRIYFNGSNTRCLHNEFEVVEYCFSIYDYLRSIGYDVEPYKQLKKY